MTIRAPYTAALRLATPLLLARLLWRSRRAPAYRRRWRERLGYGPSHGEGTLWVHAVSVGETIAAAPLIETLLATWPQRPVLLTSTTPTGSAQVQALFSGRVDHSYLPFDTPGAVERFLARSRPALGVIMETEIWPNLLAATASRGIPMILANARLSARSARGYCWIPKLTADALQQFSVIAAQHQSDAKRFQALGARPASVEVTGSLKFDRTVSPTQRKAGRQLRAALGDRPVWVAASTHAGEETAVLSAHRQVLLQHADAALILVPRHPERFLSVIDLTGRHNFRTARRTDGNVAALGTAEVLIGDTMGELPALLAAGDVAFMGGSLVPAGGHNPLEPAALGLPVLTGATVHNFAHIFNLLVAADAARVVDDADALADAVNSLFGDVAARSRAGAAAIDVITTQRGALGRLTAIAARFLG